MVGYVAEREADYTSISCSSDLVDVDCGSVRARLSMLMAAMDSRNSSGWARNVVFGRCEWVMTPVLPVMMQREAFRRSGWYRSGYVLRSRPSDVNRWWAPWYSACTVVDPRSASVLSPAM